VLETDVFWMTFRHLFSSLFSQNPHFFPSSSPFKGGEGGNFFRAWQEVSSYFPFFVRSSFLFFFAGF